MSCLTNRKNISDSMTQKSAQRQPKWNVTKGTTQTRWGAYRSVKEPESTRTLKTLGKAKEEQYAQPATSELGFFFSWRSVEIELLAGIRPPTPFFL